MPGQLLNTVTVLVLVAIAAGCTRLPQESRPGMPGSVSAETLNSFQTIPAEWGTLAGVGDVSNTPNMTRLWFEGEDGTVRLILYNSFNSRLLDSVAVIRRR